MFYLEDILSLRRRGKLAHVWLVATLSEKAYKSSHGTNSIATLNIVAVCEEILKVVRIKSKKPSERYSIYLSSQLMFGVTKILLYQTIILEGKITDIKRNFFGHGGKKGQSGGFNAGDDFALPNPISPTKALNKALKLKQDLHILQEESDLETGLKYMMHNQSVLNFGALIDDTDVNQYDTSGPNLLDILERPNLRLVCEDNQVISINDEFFHESIIEEHVHRVSQSSPTKRMKSREVLAVVSDNVPALTKSPKRRRSAAFGSENQDPSLKNDKNNKENLTKRQRVISRDSAEHDIIEKSIGEDTSMPPHSSTTIGKTLNDNTEITAEFPTIEEQQLNQENIHDTEAINLNAPLELGLLEQVSDIHSNRQKMRKKKTIDKIKELNQELRKQWIKNIHAHTNPENYIPYFPIKFEVPAKILLTRPATSIIGNRKKKWPEALNTHFNNIIRAPISSIIDETEIDTVHISQEDIRGQDTNKLGTTESELDAGISKLPANISESSKLTEKTFKEIKDQASLKIQSANITDPTEHPSMQIQLPDITDDLDEENSKKKLDSTPELTKKDQSLKKNLQETEQMASESSDTRKTPKLRTRQSIGKDDKPVSSPISISSVASFKSGIEIKWTKHDLLGQIAVIWNSRPKHPILTFSELAPYDENTKLDAAACFILLLELHAEEKVFLKQATPFDTIYIEQRIELLSESF